MYKLNNTIEKFIEEIRSEHEIVLKQNDRWYYKDWFQSLYSKFFKSKEQDQIPLVNAFILALNRLEKIPIHFLKHSGLAAIQETDFLSHYLAANIILNQTNSIVSPELEDLSLALRRAALGLAYRLEKINGGLDSQNLDFGKFLKLREKAKMWKKRNKIFWEKDLTADEITSLLKTCCYPDFYNLLIDDSNLQEQLFTWVIQNGLKIDVFVEFPALQKKIVNSALDGRIGKVNNNLLKIQKINSNQEINLDFEAKIVTLPFEGKEFSILDESIKIVFKGNYTLTLKQIFRVFENKIVKVGDLEVFANGIANWNAHRMGWWDAQKKSYQQIDLLEEEWWSKLPVLDVLTKTKTQERYGAILDNGQWILTARASRENINLSYEKTHAYLEIAIPISNGQYQIYDFGKFATDFPANFWQTLKMFGLIAMAIIAYPDENIYSMQRQHVGYSFEVTSAEGHQCMEMIKHDILRAREGEFVFQIESENCGKWIQILLEELLGEVRVPNLYRISLIESEPAGIMSPIFSLIKKMPSYFHSKALALLHYPAAPWKGRWVIDRKGNRIWTSLISSTFWQDTIIYLPSLLHKQHEEQLQQLHRTSKQVSLHGQEKIVTGIQDQLKK